MKPWLKGRPFSPFSPLWDGLRAFISSEGLAGNFAKAGVVVGLVVLVGAAGMAVRLDFARVALGAPGGGLRVAHGLPVEGGLAVVPRATLLIEGTQDLIASILLALLLLYIGSRARWIAILVALVALVIVPLSIAGLAWPAAILLVATLLKVVSKEPEETSKTKLQVVSALTVVIAIAVVVARYADPPTHFAMANVWTANNGVPNHPDNCPQIPDQSSKSLVCIDGLFLGADDSALYLGRLGHPEIIGVPKDTVKELRLLSRQEPITRPYPPASILARLVGADFSVTPYSTWWRGSRILGTWQG